MMHGLPNLIDADTFRPLRPLRAAGGIIPYVSNFRAVAVDQMAGPIAPALRAQVTDAPRAAGALVLWSSLRRGSSIAPGPFLLGRCRYSSRDRLIEPDLSCGPIGWWLQRAEGVALKTFASRCSGRGKAAIHSGSHQLTAA